MPLALIGNIMISNIGTNISATTATGVTSGSSQVLASNILANTTLGSGNYTHQWSYTGTTITFTASQSNSTNCTYGSLSVSGSTTIYCTVSDNWTGVKTVTNNCVITWPVQTIPITAVTWSIGSNTNSTYNGFAQSVSVVSVTPSGATYNTATTTATNVAENASTTITGTGNYSGSFTSPVQGIVAATLTASTTTGSATFNGNSQMVTVLSGINGTYSGSTSVSGTNAGPYSTTITGTGNYSGSVTGTLTINAATLTASTTTGSATFNGNSQTVTVLSGINGTYSGSTSVSGTNAGPYSTTITGTGNYSGSVGGTLTIGPATIALYAPLGYTGVPSLVYNGSSQSMSYTVGGTAMGYSGYTISGTSGTYAGVYTASITSQSTNYVVSSTYNSFTWYITTPLSAGGKPNTEGATTYNGSPQSFTISNINGSYTGSATVTGTAANTYTTTIYGSSFYTGSVTGTLTINPAALSASSTSVNTTYNGGQQSFTIGGINGTYTGSPTVYGTAANSYSTTIYGSGNYNGSVTGTLNIYQASGYIDIFYGGVYDASNTTGFYVPVRTANAAFSVTHSVSGPGSGDAVHTSEGRSGPYNWAQEAVPAGAYVRNNNPQTQGWVLTITATITDPNYSTMSATTTVTFNAYVAPPSGGGGGTYY